VENRIEEDMQDVQDRGRKKKKKVMHAHRLRYNEERRKISGWQDGQDEKRLIVQLKFYPVHPAILFFSSLFSFLILHILPLSCFFVGLCNDTIVAGCSD
jgi:hypothetical protein